MHMKRDLTIYWNYYRNGIKQSLRIKHVVIGLVIQCPGA